ncbi:MAG: hypothetical protein AB8G15_02845 [Saprospiraceae bacterium]
MKYSILLLLGMSLLAMACGDNYQAQQAAHDKVMEIHDDVMPKTSEIQRLVRSLKKHLKIEEGQPPLDDATKAKIESVMQQLEAADEGMMSWMSSYKKPKKEMEKAAALAYLEKEKAQITKVRTEMLASIEVGTALVRELEGKVK